MRKNAEREVARQSTLGRSVRVNQDDFREAMYRPFFLQHLHLHRGLGHLVYRLSSIYPKPGVSSPGIFVGNSAARQGFGVLATDMLPDVNIQADPGRVFPRYTHLGASGKGQATLLHPQEDNITPSALAAYRECLGTEVSSDGVFAYVYGVLHSPEYRQRYSADLEKMLPRIPDPADRPTFDAFAEAGQELLNLHIGYGDVDPHPLDEQVAIGAPPPPDLYRVAKMRWGGPAREPDRSRIVYNNWITLAGIPDEAHDYVVGPRSALAWLIDRYQVKTDKASGIVNDVNDWGLDLGEPRYIIDLVKRVVTVSVETMRIVRALPELREAE